jgi:hypothetical protein
MRSSWPELARRRAGEPVGRKAGKPVGREHTWYASKCDPSYHRVKEDKSLVTAQNRDEGKHSSIFIGTYFDNHHPLACITISISRL